jgi:hypothetical protein
VVGLESRADGLALEGSGGLNGIGGGRRRKRRRKWCDGLKVGTIDMVFTMTFSIQGETSRISVVLFYAAFGGMLFLLSAYLLSSLFCAGLRTSDMSRPCLLGINFLEYNNFWFKLKKTEIRHK